jgi:hypothetical protein
MKRFLAAIALALATSYAAPALADGCYICTSGSPCAQCSYTGSDTQSARKRCQEAGCKIGGTKSCSTAANVKTCRASLHRPDRLIAAIDALLK